MMNKKSTSLRLELYIKKLSLIALTTLFSLEVFATTPLLTGKCGATLNFMRKGAIFEDGNALSGIGILNFDKKTATGSMISFDGKNQKKTSLSTMSWTFEIKDGYFEGSALLVPSDSNKPTIQILPVNNGNSHLLQVIDTDAVGVCQKI